MMALWRNLRRGSAGDFSRKLSAAPLYDLEALVGGGPVFVLAPHPDDESIGCGGLIAACVEAGVPVFVHVLTDGRHSHAGSQSWPPTRIAEAREREALSACACLGLAEDAVTFERAHDGSLLFDWAAAQRLASKIAARADAWQDPIVVAPWRGDPHPDHMATAVIADMIEETHARARGLRYMVWAHEHAHELGDSIDASSLRRFSINAHRHRKRRAILAHQTQTSRLIGDVARQRVATPDLNRVVGRYEYYLASRR